MSNDDLKTYIAETAQMKALHNGVAAAINSLAEAAQEIAKLAATNGLSASQNGVVTANLGDLAGGKNDDGDSQKQLDVISDSLVQQALSRAGVGCYFSEEQSVPIILHEGGAIGVACDPLDGSSNIDTNLTIGTIFSVFSMADCQDGLPPVGRKQIAAGLFVYGPQTSMLLSFGDEVAAFGLLSDGTFARLSWDIAIPKSGTEFAINASNAAFWPAPIQAYIHTLSYGDGAHLSGMRWLGSLVADAYRIFRRGGVFLYPQDRREGYEQGRLRLIYEANPIAFLVKAAGGKASSGTQDILDVTPTHLHQRVPLIFGSSDMVDEITASITQTKQEISS